LHLFIHSSEQAETVTIGDPSNKFKITAASLERYKQSLVEMFPEEEEAIDKFLDMCQKSQKAWAPSMMLKVLPYPLTRFLVTTRLFRLFDGGFVKYSQMTVAKVLEDLTDNKDLRAILSSNFGDFGITPDRAPLLLQGVVHQYYWNGSFYPRGGPSTLPKKIIKNILAHGGKVFTKAFVKKILVDEEDGKTVKGVEMDDGSVIHAKTVVSDVGFHTTATKLLPAGLLHLDYGERDEKDGDNKMHPSCSGVNLFIGLKGSPKSLNLPNGINWMYPTNDLSGDFGRLENMSLEQALNELKPRDIPMIVSIPCTTDSEWDSNHPNRSVLEILTLVPWHWFEKYANDFEPSAKGHGPEYADAKTKLAKLMWSRVVEVLEDAGAKLPHNLDDVDLCDVATPLTFEHFYAADHGGWYGIEFDKNKLKPSNYLLKLRPKIHGVDGLYLTGQDVMSMGIEPCAMSGVMAAASVLGHKGNPFAMLMPKDDENKEKDESGDWSIEGTAHAH
jgi:all-trans-retinol 13,14-reductase